MFRENIGTLDRIFRIVVGAVLLSLVFIGPQSWLGLIGLVPLVTGIFSRCPLYSVLGISTCPMKKA